MNASSFRGAGFKPWAECVVRCGIVTCLAGIAVAVALLGGNEPQVAASPVMQLPYHASDGASDHANAAASAGWTASSNDEATNYAAQDVRVMDRASGLGLRRMIEFVIVPMIPIGIMLVVVLMFRKDRASVNPLETTSSSSKPAP